MWWSRVRSCILLPPLFSSPKPQQIVDGSPGQYLTHVTWVSPIILSFFTFFATPNGMKFRYLTFLQLVAWDAPIVCVRISIHRDVSRPCFKGNQQQFLLPSHFSMAFYSLTAESHCFFCIQAEFIGFKKILIEWFQPRKIPFSAEWSQSK